MRFETVNEGKSREIIFQEAAHAVHLATKRPRALEGVPMTYNQFLIGMAVATARGEKAMMRRMSKRASERRQRRAIDRKANRLPE